MTDFLQLRSLKTLEVLSSEDRYVVKAEGVLSWTTCPLCRKGRLHGHGSQEQSFQDTPSHGKPVEVFIQRRRYRCTGCGKTLFEPVADFDGKRQATARLVRYIREQSFTKTFAALAREVALDEKTIRHVFDDFVEEIERTVKFRTPRILGIDELKIIGQYRAMITNVERKTVFDLRPSRAKADLLPYFRNLRDKDTIEWVAMDMYAVYKQVVRATLPQARIVVDRFHIQRMANDALEKLRKQIRKGMPARQRLKLKDERFLLLKRQHDLAAADMQRAMAWFSQFPELGEAHALKEGFLSIWDHKTRADAEAACAKWLGNIPSELAGTFKELTTAVHNWHDEIFAYFEQPITNAYTESVNRLAKDMNRMGRGYSFEVIRARMLYDTKARKDGAVVETVLVDGDLASTNFEFQRMTMTSIRKKQVRRVVEYGPYIPTLVRLLEEGHFE
ncbi:MAG: ISL3 family transposase [Gammaproteobacteria bacterium]|nr:MAG: ISL3 family transposase [Gammaproteobacteria bacterium]